MAKITLKQVKAACADAGCTVSRCDGEYRVNLKGFGERTAYYTTDPQDAMNTARSMRARHSSKGDERTFEVQH